MVTKFRCRSINLSLCNVNHVRRILGEFTGTGSMGAVEVAPVMVNPAPSTRQKSRRKVLPHLRRKRDNVSETTADVVPVLAHRAKRTSPPETKDRPRNKVRPKSVSKKSAVQSILGESDETVPEIIDRVVPVLAHMAPEVMKKLKDGVDSKSVRGVDLAAALIVGIVNAILGESNEKRFMGESDEKSLIPDDAEELLTTKEVDDAKNSETSTINLDKEDLLQPSLALVAPDTTPNATKELDPSLVPNADPALSTILGEKPSAGPTNTVKTESVKKVETESVKKVETPKTEESIVNESKSAEESLPSHEMPRPPGEFLRSIGDITGEGREEKPRVELVVGNSSSPVGSAVSEGMLGASEMPTPKEANIDRTMDAFRRFHRVKI